MESKDFYKGGESILYIKFNDAFAPVACLTTHTISETAESLETTIAVGLGESWRTYTPDFQSYNLQASGLKINDQDGQYSARLSLPKLKTLKRSRTIFDWEIRTGGGTFLEFGTGFITSLTENAAIGEYINFDVSIIGVGQLNSIKTDGSTTFDRTDITWDDDTVTFDED